MLHAAARCQRVLVRGHSGINVWHRGSEETKQQFLKRLLSGVDSEGIPGSVEDCGPLFAALYRGDLSFAIGSSVYALFRENIVSPVNASDLIC